MNHRELLKKYMAVVYDIAGGDCCGLQAKSATTEEEFKELLTISDELEAEGKLENAITLETGRVA